ncbi:alkaline-phosphatase-like protein [Halenospora varia]|nr:alkaline-phosphatase-like protein [Halenospora varia]
MAKPPATKPPNFLIIIADDLGYSDIGCYGSEIRTPNLDKLAQDGIRMTNFHTAAACSPTRSMLFSGTDNHIAGLGQMMEYMIPFKDYFRDKPGYEGYLNWRVAALSEIMQDEGYLNIFSGKWHLGLTKELAPCSRGFKKNFTFLPGAGNHYGYEPQLEDEVYFPALKSDGLWMEREEFLDHKTQLPKDFYSTTSFTDKLIEYFRQRTKQEKERPFFASPRHVVQKYAVKYDDGPDKLASSRLRRLVEMGMIEEGVEMPPPVGSSSYEWSQMTAEERARSARTMEVFAAMVQVIDENVGRILEFLKLSNELDNTFVLFMSDNGAEGAALEAVPVMGGPKTMSAIFEKYYNNSLNNIGEPDSFVWYGPRWASAATAPSRGIKSWITEGGIHCPCLIRYPPFHPAPAAITHSFTTVMDILPTVLSLAGLEHPGTTFQGREVVPVRGKSWVPHLTSPDYSKSSVHGEDVHIHGWEFLDQRAIREGKWKAVWMTKPRGKGDWELYKVEEDPGELHDHAEEQPELLQRLVFHWEQYYAETGMIPTPMFAARTKRA